MNLGTLNRRNAARLVLVLWAAALAWLARRQLGRPELQTIAEATLRLSPGANFYSVVARGQQVGYASVTVDTVPAGFFVSEVMALDVPEADSIRRFTRRIDMILSRTLRLREFTRTITGGGIYEQLGGRIEGDSLLRFFQRDVRAVDSTVWTLPVRGDIVLPQVLPYRLAFTRRLAVGQTIVANVLDLNVGTVDTVEFRATAESTFVVADSAIEQRGRNRWRAVTYDTVRAWRIEHQVTGQPTVAWVDAQGGLVRSEAALGVRLERSAFELVNFNYRDELARTGPDSLRGIPAMRTLVGAGVNPGGAVSPATWQVTSDPVERFLLPRLAWLEGGRQAAREGHIRIGGDTALRGAGARTRSEYLSPPPRAGSSIGPIARTAVKGASDPREMVERLVRWVSREIEVDATHAAPTMTEHVLATRRAGAEGHARLLTDLAAELGLTVRPVSGIAVLGRGVFGHAWNEAYLDGRWIPIDPTFGHVPASTHLLRVMVGGSARAIDLVPLLGSATFTPVETVTRR